MSTFKTLRQFGASVYNAVDTFLETCVDLVMSLPSLPRDLYHRWFPCRASLQALAATLEAMGQSTYIMDTRLYWVLRGGVVITMDIDTSAYATRATAYAGRGYMIDDVRVLAFRVHAATVWERATNTDVRNGLGRMCIEMLQTLEESPEYVQHHARSAVVGSMSGNTLAIVRSTRVALQCVYTPRDLSQSALVWDFLTVSDLCDDPLLLEHYAHTATEVAGRILRQRDRSVSVVFNHLEMQRYEDSERVEQLMQAARRANKCRTDAASSRVEAFYREHAIVATPRIEKLMSVEPQNAAVISEASEPEAEESYW